MKMFPSQDPGLVALSILVSILAAYAARALTERVRKAQGRAWLAWVAGAAIVNGVGTWSMHYTRMLALQLPVPVRYDFSHGSLFSDVGYLAVVLQQENPTPLSVDPEDYFFTTPAGTPIDVGNFYKREWLPILKAKKIRPGPFYNTRHSYVSFLYSIGARSGFISNQTGDSIKTLEKDYAKYIKEAG